MFLITFQNVFVFWGIYAYFLFILDLLGMSVSFLFSFKSQRTRVIEKIIS